MRLKLALTKGRLEKKSAELFERAGLDCSPLREDTRRLIHSLPNYPLDIVLAKSADVITYVENGVCDLGIVGKDTILEQGNSFYEVLDLGFGKCRFALCAKKGEDIFGKTRDLRIATKYPNVAKSFFDKKGLNTEIIKIDGSVELAPLLGLSDAIVDIVETGTTLRENGLEPVEFFCNISARLIINIASMKMNKSLADDFVDRLRAKLV
jgi:ATP phosphoribosyltransferase